MININVNKSYTFKLNQKITLQITNQNRDVLNETRNTSNYTTKLVRGSFIYPLEGALVLYNNSGIFSVAPQWMQPGNTIGVDYCHQ